MILPDLTLQFTYSRLAWGMLLAALLVGLTHRRFGARWQELLVTALSFAMMWLPGAASPAHWLGLVFQFPSAALVTVCAVSLLRRRTETRPVPVNWFLGAFALAAGGALLYLDSAGWTNLELYALGVDPRIAPLAALALGAVALGAMRAESTRPTGVVLLASVVTFSMFRLPSGNLFDALLDPLLWIGSIGLTLSVACRHLRRSGNLARAPAA